MTRLSQATVFSAAILTGSLAFAELADEFTVLRSRRDQSVSAALRDIDTKYLAGLTALKAKYTKAGDLQKAVEVDEEIKEITAGMASMSTNTAAPLKLADLDGDWLSLGGQTRKMKSGILYNDGDKKAATLTIENAKERKVSLQWGNTTDIMKVSANGDMMSGKNKPHGDAIWFQKVAR